MTFRRITYGRNSSFRSTLRTPCAVRNLESVSIILQGASSCQFSSCKLWFFILLPCSAIAVENAKNNGPFPFDVFSESLIRIYLCRQLRYIIVFSTYTRELVSRTSLELFHIMSSSDGRFLTPSNHGALVGMAVAIGMVWAILVFSIRIFIRLSIVPPFGQDDATASLGLVVTL